MQEKFSLLKEQLKRILVVQAETYVSYLKMYKEAEETYHMYRIQKDDYDKINQVSNIVKGTSSQQMELKKLVEKILKEYDSENVMESFLYQEANLGKVLDGMKGVLEKMLGGIFDSIRALIDAGRGYTFKESEWKTIRGMIIVYNCKTGDYMGSAKLHKDTWNNISSDRELERALEESDKAWFREQTKNYLM